MYLHKSRAKNELSKNQNALSNKNARNAHASIYTYMKLFQIFGIYIRHVNQKITKSTLVFTTKNLMRIAWSIFLCKLILETYLIFKGNENSKFFLVLLALFCGAYLMWNHIIKCEANLIEVIRKLRKLEKLLEISPPEKTVKFCCLLLIKACILSVYADIHDYDSLSKLAIRNFTVGTKDSSDFHWSIRLVAFITDRFAMQYEYFFVNYFTNFYIIVCRYMVVILSRHVEMNECIIKRHFTTYDNYGICFIRYDTILILFEAVNSILEFPIFLSSCYNACGILISALYIWKHTHNVFFTEIFFLMNSFLLFTATVFSASAVNKADKRAKKSHIRILRSLSRRDRSQLKESIEGISQMCYSAPFALTGWDVFEFTKSFYFTAIGCFATYSLLIINL